MCLQLRQLLLRPGLQARRFRFSASGGGSGFSDSRLSWAHCLAGRPLLPLAALGLCAVCTASGLLLLLLLPGRMQTPQCVRLLCQFEKRSCKTRSAAATSDQDLPQNSLRTPGPSDNTPSAALFIFGSLRIVRTRWTRLRLGRRSRQQRRYLLQRPSPQRLWRAGCSPGFLGRRPLRRAARLRKRLPETRVTGRNGTHQTADSTQAGSLSCCGRACTRRRLLRRPRQQQQQQLGRKAGRCTCAQGGQSGKAA